MSYWKSFTDWCQRPSKIKIRTFNPRNAIVLATISIILASSITFGAWRYQAATVPPFTYINPEDIETLTITTNTTLTEDYFGQIVINADGVTLDGDGHIIIGPGPDVWIREFYEELNTSGPRPTIGILLEGRTGVTVKNCRVTNFSYGFMLGDSHGNTLQENTANDNAYIGFVLESSSNNTFLNNTANDIGKVDDPGNGFEIGRSFGNTFKRNTVNGNWIGFVLEMSDGNIFEANTANNNTHAGFSVGGSNNTFFHNNLVGNAIQVAVPPHGHPGRGYANTWDDCYPSGGNYWSDYEGVDADGDGIGDTPYVIIPFFGEYDEDNVDRFPLMAPFSVFDDGT
jgi:parallel beta-helix repeat protein